MFLDQAIELPESMGDNCSKSDQEECYDVREYLMNINESLSFSRSVDKFSEHPFC